LLGLQPLAAELAELFGAADRRVLRRHFELAIKVAKILDIEIPQLTKNKAAERNMLPDGFAVQGRMGGAISGGISITVLLMNGR
jgi:hypothetical protein